MEDKWLYSGGTDSFEMLAAEFSASAPVVYKTLLPWAQRFDTPLVLWRGPFPPAVVVYKILSLN